MASRYSGTFTGECGYLSEVTYVATGQPVKTRLSIRFIPKSNEQTGFEWTAWVYDAQGTECLGEVIGHFTWASSANLITWVSTQQVPVAGKNVLAHRAELHSESVTRVTVGGVTMDHTSISGAGDLVLGPLRIESGFLSQTATMKDLLAVTDDGKLFYTGRDDSVDATGYPTTLEDRGPWTRQP